MIDAFSILLSLAVTPWAPSVQPEATTVDCDVSAMRTTLERARGWQDVGPAAVDDRELEAYFEKSLPGYRLAYLHRDSLGVLLIDGRALPSGLMNGSEAEGPDRRWSQVAEEARAACAESAVSCDVSMLSSLPMGVSADSVLADSAEGETLQRVTVAFDGPGRCAYSVQFTSPAEAFTATAWRKLRDELIALRKIVVSSRESRPERGF